MHVLDLAPLDGSDPAANHAVIERELAAHDPRLAALPRVLALSKADLVAPGGGRGGRRGWRERMGTDVPVLVTSSATRQGLDALSARAAAARAGRGAGRARGGGRGRGGRVQGLPAGGAARAFEVERIGDGEFRVTGDAVDRLIARHDMENDEALAHVEHRLRRMGVIAALEARGFEPGDDVELGGIVFELDPGSPLLAPGNACTTQRRGASLPGTWSSG